jgi:hypothetical protein
MSIVVDLPAPFGPSSATVSPGAIDTSRSRTASIAPCGARKVFASPSSSIPVCAAMRPSCLEGGPAR